MKLYYHPVSTVSRPIMLLAADEGIALDYQLVDLFSGEHKQSAYLSINPSGQVPTLEDGGFRLTECSAILKYLADLKGTAIYPKDARKRARVHELMDWFNTGFYRDFGYGLVYAQAVPDQVHADAAVQDALLQRALARTRNWLTVLDHSIIGAHASYLCGNELTLADYFGICLLTAGEVVHLNYEAWPHVTRWINTMKARPNWAPVNEGFYQHFVGACKDGQYLAL